MDVFTTRMRWRLRIGALLFIVVATSASSLLFAQQNEFGKFFVAGAVAGALIIGALGAILAHGEGTPRADRTDFIGKVFTFAGAAPGIFLAVLSLAPASNFTPKFSVPEAPAASGGATPDPSPTPLSAIFVELKAQSVVQDAFTQAHQSPMSITCNALAIGAGVAAAFLLLILVSAVMWGCVRYAQRKGTGKLREPRVPWATVTQVHAVTARGRYAQLGALGGIAALIVSMILTTFSVRRR
ncbi:hypothetical protein [Microbacterium sp. 16-032]|uniref:hypothetical protein n=1 Tax=Microbacterium sp. 16-032 TaxID=3239808 RepID=UPI0034E2D190